ELDQVLEPLVDCAALPDRALELAHAAHHLRLVGPDLDRFDATPVRRVSSSQLFCAPAHEPVDELDDWTGLVLRYSLNSCHRGPPAHRLFVRSVDMTRPDLDM